MAINPEILQPIAFDLLPLALPMILAFSHCTRQKILERDGFRCIVCGATDHLEAAHINHTRNKDYDEPKNGRTLCTKDHLQDHIDRAGRNGLSRQYNQNAIESIRARLEAQEYEEEIPFMEFK